MSNCLLTSFEFSDGEYSVKLRFHSSNRPGVWTHTNGLTKELCVGV